MRKTIGFYPRPSIDTKGTTAVGQAGGVLLTGTVRAAGLDQALSAALARWRSPFAVQDPANVLLDLALRLGLGGDTCSDLAVVRAEPTLFGPVAPDPTASRTIAALARDVERVLIAIDRARALARARVWKLAGSTPPSRCAGGGCPHRRRPHRGAPCCPVPAAGTPARDKTRSQGVGAHRRGRVDPPGHWTEGRFLDRFIG